MKLAARARAVHATRVCMLVWAVLCADCIAVDAPDAPEQSAQYPQAGLYTPGNTLGASDPSDMPQHMAAVGDRCKTFAAPDTDAGVDATAGVLRIEYSTQTTRGDYAPKNCGATWLESAAGSYVATLELRAALRRPALVYFAERACAEQPGPDVMTAATSANHERAHILSWRGRDAANVLVPDGQYKLFIEGTETDKAPGEFETVEFTKGPVPFDVQPALSETGPLSALSLVWRPAVEAKHAP